MQLEGQVLGIYRVGPELGRGGMGAVYRCVSTEEGPAGPAGAEVALKVFHPHLADNASALERFEREGRIGLRIDHPNVVRTWAMGHNEVDGHHLHYIAMEVIEGQTLANLLAELGSVPEHLLYQIADQVLAALAEIHARGIVHRDLKPENIVITPDNRVLLMDLGVARLVEEESALTRTGEFVGSIAYAAPEQFTAPDTVGPRGDLYAFGVVLYQLATGVNPYEGDDLPGVMRSKIHEEPKPPRTVRSDLDPFWNEIILTCLGRDPTQRFGSAGELRQVLREGERSEWWRIRSAGRAVPSAERALRRLRLEREVSLIGRGDALEMLERVYEESREQGRALLIGGATGVGKSRLLYEFLERISSAQGPSVAAGRCLGSGDRSYQPFVEALTDLLEVDTLQEVGRKTALAERLAEYLPGSPGVVPKLAEFLLGGLQPGPESGFTKDALHSAMAGVLRIAAAHRPVVLVVEDLHQAGPESLELFAYLARCVGGHPLLLVGIYAADEVEAGSELDGLIRAIGTEACGRVEALPPLSAEATEQIVRDLLGTERTVRELAWPLHEKSEGNPLIVLELLAHMKSAGHLRREDGGYAFVARLDEIQLPNSVSGLVGLRLGRLDEDERETVEAAAVLGVEFPASMLADVLEEKSIRLLKRLAGLERTHRLLRSSGKDTFRFASHRLYEAVYEAISPPLRIEYHAVVADTMLELAEDEAPSGVAAWELLRHLHLAERTLEAEPFLEAALDYLGKSFHASFAVPFLERIAEALRVARPGKRLALDMKLWAFYELLGKRAEQMRVLDEALAVAREVGEPGPEGRVLCCRAAVHWYGGDFRAAGEEAERGLDLMRRAGDRQWEANALHTLGGVAWRLGDPQAAAARWREALEVRREIGDRRGEASSLMGLAAIMPLIGEGDRALETKLEALEISREIGERRVEAGLLNNVGNSLTDAGRHEEALSRFDASAQISRELGDRLGEALALLNLGRVHKIVGGIERAREGCERAIELFGEIGNTNGEIMGRLFFGEAIAEYGEFELARAHLERALELAEETGNKGRLVEAQRALGALLFELKENDAARALLESALELAEQSGITAAAYASLLSLGSAALDAGEADHAANRLRRALEVAGTAGAGTLLAQCRLARALQLAGDHDAARDCAEEAAAVLESAERISPESAPEIHFRLWQVLGDDAAGHLESARNLLLARAKLVEGNAAYRDHYLKKHGANPEILEESRRAAGES